MGNSQSNNAPQPESSPSRSPGPGNPHPSLRQKKKSLELPDLALLSLTATTSPYDVHARRGRSPAPNPPKSASIPIPGNVDGRHRSQRDGDKSRDGGRGTQGRGQEVYPVQPSSTIENHLNPNRRIKPERERESSPRRGRPRASGHGYGYGYGIGGSIYGYVPSNLSLVTDGSSNSDNQDAVDHSTPVLHAPPPSLSASPAPIDGGVRAPLVVRSSLPLALPRVLTMERPPPTAAGGIGEDDEEVSYVEDISASNDGKEEGNTRSREVEDAEADVMVKISWRGGGSKVFLARAGDNDWRGRTEMLSESSTSALASTTSAFTTFSTTIPLQPGTHHFRFLVDDQWRVSDDYPAAVDETGNLTNYLEVSGSTRVSTEFRDAIHSKEKEKDKDMGGVQSKASSKTRAAAARHGHPQPPSHAEAKLHLDIPGPDSLQQAQGQTLSTGPELSTTPGTATGVSPSTITTPLVIHSNAEGFPIDLAAASPRVVHPDDADVEVSGSRVTRPPGYGYGYSFWSASSTNEAEVEVVGGPEDSPTSTHPVDGIHAIVSDSVDGSDSRVGRKGRAGEKGRFVKVKSKSKMKYEPRWTNEIPLELIEAAKEEEDYLAYQAELRERSGRNSQHTRVNGFRPLPNIPQAPGLPRYLDKLILNTPVQPRNVVGLGGIGSPAATTYAPVSLSPEADPRRTLKERKSRDKDRLGLSALPTLESTSSEPSGSLPVTTASGTDVTAVLCGETKRPEGIHGSRAFHGYVQRHHSHNGGSNTPVSTALPTTLPTTAPGYEDTIIADDPSMLPVPSHVVIHHLCTSAIRNGVLAIGETVRYRKKFVTSVYYKPAS